MCGVAGYIGPEEIHQRRIRTCLDLMRRRGPDSNACYAARTADGRHVYLLNSRLSIIDLNDRADQPYRVGSYVMTYNGELYNYLERKRDLEGRGESFVTESDTEVVLRSIVRDGPDSLERCEGMWALAAFDEETDRLLLSRDRFGEKPLYIYETSDGMFFASEPKFLFALLGRKLPINLQHLFRFAVNGYKALYKSGDTFFEGMEEFPRAAYRWFGEGDRGQVSFWEPDMTVDEGMSYQQAVKDARAALLRSVELRLRADVPLAFCMSGGVDSNALISIARRVFDYDVHGFTIVNDDARYEEQDLVNLAVAELGIRHDAIPVETRDFLPRLRQLVRQHDAPVYTITYYAHWLLMESIAAHGYRISISGTAADELFSGYYDHHLAYLAEVSADPARYEDALLAWKTHVLPFVRNPHLQDPELFRRDPNFRDHIYLNANQFSDYLYEPWRESFTEASFMPSLLKNRMLNEMFHEAVPVILHEDDRNAMFYSIENRSPYLDSGLFQLSSRIPARHLVQRGYAKAVLRDSMRGIVPDPILDSHRKVGFNAPIFSFLDISDRNVKGTLMEDGPLFEHVRRDRLEQLLEKPDLPNSESKFLFSLVSIKMFLEEFAS